PAAAPPTTSRASSDRHDRLARYRARDGPGCSSASPVRRTSAPWAALRSKARTNEVVPSEGAQEEESRAAIRGCCFFHLYARSYRGFGQLLHPQTLANPSRIEGICG